MSISDFPLRTGNSADESQAATAAQRSRMERLWAETFGDPESYISLLFSRYYSPERVLCRMEGERLVASMLTVPYTFGAAAPDGRPLRGLYLCGLATVPDRRRAGIMSRMIEDINRQAAREGFDFTFLIPASEGLGEYYRQRRYHAGAFRVANHYTNVHNFMRELKNTNHEDFVRASQLIAYIYVEQFENSDTHILENTKKCFSENSEGGRLNFSGSIISENAEGGNLKIIPAPISEEKLKNILQFLMLREAETPFALRHTSEDWRAVIDETFRCGGSLAVVTSGADEVVAVAPVMPCISGECVEVRHAYASDKASLFALLQAVKQYYSSDALTFYTWPGQLTREGVWAPYYASDTPDSSVVATDAPVNVDVALARPYAMFRLLNRQHVAEYMSAFGLMQPGADRDVPDEALAEMIWRAPSSSHFVDSITGISRLPSELAFMLD